MTSEKPKSSSSVFKLALYWLRESELSNLSINHFNISSSNDSRYISEFALLHKKLVHYVASPKRTYRGRPRTLKISAG